MMLNVKLVKLKSWKHLSCIAALIGGIQFIVVTFIAMFFYPDGYSFTEDYFSFLGTTINVRTYSPNRISRILFVIACVVAGASLIPFWIVITTLFKNSDIARYLSYFGSILGIISSPLLMGAGIFPGDKMYETHSFSAKYFFLLFAAAILIYSIAILLNENYQNIYAFIGFGFSVLIVLYILRFFIQIGPLMQKIIAYGFISWAGLQVIKIWKTINLQDREQ